uniref:Uncharacterized protein n=1 Tax=mine drainage metagenome TaxID=410659 RepID=E6QPD8_9ZZZZ
MSMPPLHQEVPIEGYCKHPQMEEARTRRCELASGRGPLRPSAWRYQSDENAGKLTGSAVWRREEAAR